MSMVLQELLSEFGCNVLNYTNGKIIVDHFYSPERYADFLNGINCRQGMGQFESNEILKFNKISDNILVIVQSDGIEIERYLYKTIFKATIEYKDNKVNKLLTFRIRKDEYDSKINFIDTLGSSLDFNNSEEIKEYLKNRYGVNKIIDWSVGIG